MEVQDLKYDAWSNAVLCLNTAKKKRKYTKKYGVFGAPLYIFSSQCGNPSKM